MLNDLARTAVAGVAIAGALLVGTHAVEADAAGQNRYHGPTNKPRWLTHACPYEDSINCYWNARKQGNGKGHSFWAIPVGKTKKGSIRVAIVYWQPKYNKRHGQVITNW